MKTTTRHPLRWIALALILVLAAACLWLHRPMTVEALSLDLDWEQLQTVNGYYCPSDISAPIVKLASTSAEDPELQALITLWRQTEVRRDPVDSLITNLGLGNLTHPIPEGAPYDVGLYLIDPEGYLALNQYGDAVEIRYITYSVGPGWQWQCSLPEGEPLWQAAIAFMDAHQEAQSDQ